MSIAVLIILCLFGLVTFSSGTAKTAWCYALGSLLVVAGILALAWVPYLVRLWT